ncbi:MAG: hypothetical protein ABJC36_04200 [Gemmatimonadales bacterium]
MDIGPALVFGAAWLVLNAIRKAASKPPGQPRTPPRRPPVTTSRPAGTTARPGVRSLPDARPKTLAPVTGADATQREGSALESLLRELGRTLDQASGPAGRAPDRRLPSAEQVEERESLEVTPEVRSLETDPRRAARVEVDRDDEAEEVVARRFAAAEAQGKPLTRAERVALDARIRQEPADMTATRGYSVHQLRDAVVWREILGPPLSLRGEGEER